MLRAARCSPMAAKARAVSPVRRGWAGRARAGRAACPQRPPASSYARRTRRGRATARSAPPGEARKPRTLDPGVTSICASSTWAARLPPAASAANSGSAVLVVGQPQRKRSLEARIVLAGHFGGDGGAAPKINRETRTDTMGMTDLGSRERTSLPHHAAGANRAAQWRSPGRGSRIWLGGGWRRTRGRPRWRRRRWPAGRCCMEATEMRGFPCAGESDSRLGWHSASASPRPKPKPRYRVTNWREYNRALVARGSITLWIDEAVVAGWRATGGKGRRYSDAAILCALSLRAVFGLTLRQTQGFLCDLTRLLGLDDRGSALFHLLPPRGRAHRAEARAARRRRPAAPRHRRHRAQGAWRGRVEGPRARQGQAPGLAQAAPGRGHPDRRCCTPTP